MKIRFLNTIHSHLFRWMGCACLLLSLVAVSSCKENISAEDYAIATEQTITEYLEDNPDRFSEIYAIFNRVKLGSSANASSIASVLTARGNYTVFAPNNEAVAYYLDSLGYSSISELTDDEAQLIAYSCIIDCGEDDAYETADFPATGTFTETNISNRRLTCVENTNDTTTYYTIASAGNTVETDIELSNGIIHEVDGVITPSSDNVYELMTAAENLKVICHLMDITSWADSMATDLYDEKYEEEGYSGTYTTSAVGSGTIYYPDYRQIGYTAFVEPDSIFETQWGISLVKDEEGNVTNWTDVEKIIKDKCEAVFGTTDSDDYTSPDNAVNRFVAYHLLYGMMAYDRFVLHCNEYDYSYGSDATEPQTVNCPVNIWDYYTTLGQYPGLMKITQVGDEGFENDLDHNIYINRISVYNDSRSGDYRETGVEDAGLKVSPSNGIYNNEALNGYYFPIDGILMYDDDTRSALGGERIRIDITTMLPEIASNNCRGTGYYIFPEGYFDNLTNQSSSTEILYLHHAYSSDGSSWRDYQGDEIMGSGQYDFILKLPPVPQSGTYELRMGASHNSLRGMVQLYFGSTKTTLSPVGLPYDMRQTVGTVAVPWEDDTDDDTENAENDKNMRNQGYMKAPKYFHITSSSASATSVRDVGGSSAAIRRIITTANLDAGTTYYLRFKSVLNSTTTQLFLDYFEFVPTSVYNGVEEEDIW